MKPNFSRERKIGLVFTILWQKKTQKREAKKILNKLYYLDEIQYNALKTMINS